VRIENTFRVSAPPEQAWELLMDVPRVIPCMPGAELTETIDDATWKAKVGVKLGPISLTFNSDVKRVEADEAAHRAMLEATANEARGRGSAQAKIESSLTPIDGGTEVDIVTDLTLVGAVAQYGRGIVPDVASQLVTQFAQCLEKQLAATSEPEVATEAAAASSPPPEPQPVKPVGGLRLGMRATMSKLGRSIRQLLGRGA
jgi:carbon monoxide dehydrogenase subunit G